jgi:ABC-2 type transport system ATP-binding protein
MVAETRCECSGLRKKFGRREVLKQCSLSLHSGELVGVTGENGSGKSTLVRCLLGFIRPTSGWIRLDSSVGYCPQENYLNSRFTLSEHLRFATAILGGDVTVNRKHTDWLLQTLKLGEHLGRRMGELSGGTTQKVKFLTSILNQPHLLVLDEPTDGFDWAMYLAYWDIVAQLRREGAAVLMISHFLYDQTRFDRVYELREGTLEENTAHLDDAGLPH